MTQRNAPTDKYKHWHTQCLLGGSWNTNPHYDNTTPFCRISFFPTIAVLCNRHHLEWMEVAPVRKLPLNPVRWVKVCLPVSPEILTWGTTRVIFWHYACRGGGSAWMTVWAQFGITASSTTRYCCSFDTVGDASFGPWCCYSYELTVAAIGIKQELPSAV